MERVRRIKANFCDRATGDVKVLKVRKSAICMDSLHAEVSNSKKYRLFLIFQKTRFHVSAA